MQINQIEIYQLPVRLREPFVISLGKFECAENIVVVIRTSNGITGFGECSPFFTINGENMETGYIAAKYLARVLIGKNPLDIDLNIRLMDSVVYGNYSIKSAFDMAIYDIAAQNENIPLYRFLGGKNNKQIFTDYTVSIDNAAKMADDALKITEKGFKYIKVKLGGNASDDVERILQIRKKIGCDIPLRLDANQGWDMGSAIHILNSLSDYNIEFCEEPVKRGDFMAMARINKESKIPVMADESCSTLNDIIHLIHFNSCSKINIKLGKSGGIRNAMKILAESSKSGFKVQVGGFLESRLGFTASAHFALTDNNISYYDFDTPLMFEEDPIEGGIVYLENGEIQVPDSPGIGASINENYLSRLKHQVIRS